MRIARLYVPGLLHHVIARLVDRRFFLDLPGARERYLFLLGRSLAQSDWRCTSYALMSNHVHHGLIAGQEEPEHLFKRIHSPFANWLNDQCAGLGTIFADRPKMLVVPDGKAGDVLAYIHNNPVRAGVVKTAAGSAWTSHNAYIGRAAAPPWLDTIEGLRLSGFAEDPQGFDRWVDASVDAPDPMLEGERRIRVARELTRRRGGEVATPILGTQDVAPRLRSRGTYVRPSAEAAVAAVARVLGVDFTQIRARQREALEVRRVSILVGARLGIPTAQVSAALGITRQHGSRLAQTRREEDEHVIKLLVKQLEANVAECDTVPIEVGGKRALRAGRR